MDAETNTGLPWERQRMEDGASWFHSTVPEIPGSLIPAGSLAVLTSEGNKIFKNPRTWLKLLVYKRAVDSYKRKSYISKHLGGEGNGTVYALGKSKIAIKEAGNGQSIHFAVERMDRLYMAIERGQREGIVPRWIGMPKHYGYLIPPVDSPDKRQYMAMEQIDGGVTVEDVLERRDTIPAMRPGYAFTEADAVEISEQWRLMRLELETAIHAENLRRSADDQRTAKQLLPDFHAGNVLVDRLPRKVDGHRFKLWIIDQ